MIILYYRRAPPSFLKMKGGLMSYKYYKEISKWKEWKRKEELLLRQLSFDEGKIAELRKYDKEVFNEERRFRRSEQITEESYFLSKYFTDNKDIYTIEDLLDSIENEALCELLNMQDDTTLMILLLKVYGYSIKEISTILNINVNTIYYKIKKIKNMI